MLALLRRKHPSGIELVTDTIENYVFRSTEKFDLITSMSTLEFVPDLPAGQSSEADPRRELDPAFDIDIALERREATHAFRGGHTKGRRVAALVGLRH